jgi:hypothetical protein
LAAVRLPGVFAIYIHLLFYQAAGPQPVVSRQQVLGMAAGMHHDVKHCAFLSAGFLNTLSYIWDGISSMSATRRYVLSVFSLLGFLSILVMKSEQLIWFAASTAGAAPALEKGQAAEFRGLRFNLDGTFKISVFEDLHYGEGKWQILSSSILSKMIHEPLRISPAPVNGSIYIPQIVSNPLRFLIFHHIFCFSPFSKLL